MSRVREAVRHGNLFSVHGNKDKFYETQGQKASRTRAFWREYYPAICQVVKDREIVLPQGTVIEDIYKLNFVPWWRRKDFRDKDGVAIEPPCLRTFGKEGHHPDFGHVKRKSKHTHLRCTTCASLRVQALRGFQDGEDIEKYTAAFQAHQTDIRQWRATEAYWQTIAANSPNRYTVILGDDTSALGFPHFTNQDYKSMGTMTRVKFVPWLFHNFATDEQTYVYSLKNKFPKVRSSTTSTYITHDDSPLGRKPLLYHDDCYSARHERAQQSERSCRHTGIYPLSCLVVHVAACRCSSEIIMLRTNATRICSGPTCWCLRAGSKKFSFCMGGAVTHTMELTLITISTTPTLARGRQVASRRLRRLIQYLYHRNFGPLRRSV
jgi:hypothetical protein